MQATNKVVFDIETAGEKFDELDQTSRDVLETRFRKRAKDEKELVDAKESLSFLHG